MSRYEDNAVREMIAWQKEMQKKPGSAGSIAKNLQSKMNGIIPEKAHEIITEAIKNMVKAVLFGSEYTAAAPLMQGDLETRENLVREKIQLYKRAAAVSGAGTGAGGILLGLADFPILLSLKMKFLFDTAGLYGFDAKNYKERLYMLYVFQLAFSSQERRNDIFEIVADWHNYSKGLPENQDYFDWRTFQQEYRDYIDIAKMLQLVPGIGAIVGAYANYKLMDKLGDNSINAYRMRVIKVE